MSSQIAFKTNQVVSTAEIPTSLQSQSWFKDAYIVWKYFQEEKIKDKVLIFAFD
jgi:hypothetical protein